MSAPTRGRPVLSAWTAVSPFGLDGAAFAEGVRAGRSAVADVDPERWPDVARPAAGTVAEFDTRALLGAKGTRGMTRVSGLAVLATQHLLADIGAAPGAERDGIGLVLGTTAGSVASIMGITRASLTGDRPDHVEPAAVPGAVMNYAAGQAAIWHGLKGPNATIAAGRVTGPHALNYARRLLAAGRAEQVLCGAAEEYSATRSWVERARRDGEAPVLGEGCVMFLLEPADRVPAHRRVLATLAGFTSRVCLDDDLAGTVADAVRALLADAGLTPDRVWAATGSGHVDAGGVAIETEVLTTLFGDEVVGRVPTTGLIGDTGAVGALFQIAALLSVAERADRAERGPADHAVVTACDSDGSVACTLLQMGADQ